jgi:hypothetical protein
MSVHKKLMQARVTLQSTKLQKSGHNKFAQYYYFELGDFLPEIQNIFNNLGLCGVVSFTNDMATLTITDMEDGTTLNITSPMSSAALKGCHEVQNLGAVQTYLRRYLWVTAMEIVEHDALEPLTGSEAPTKPAPKAAPKAEPKPAPAAQAPAAMEGRDGPWQLKVTADKDVSAEDWGQLVVDASKIALENAGSQEDVMNIFKVNRNIFDKMKVDTPALYDDVMEQFKEAKAKYKKD